MDGHKYMHVVSHLGLRMFLPRFGRADVMCGHGGDVMGVICMLSIDDGGESGGWMAMGVQM